MANVWAGEVAISVDGNMRVAKLTLGALAELEGELGAGSLIELVERFEAGRFSALDIIAVLVAGLRGGGWGGFRDEFKAAELADGPVVLAQKAAQLLALAFSQPS